MTRRITDAVAITQHSARIRKGMARGAARGRKAGKRQKVSDAQIRAVIHLGTAVAARKVGLSKSWYIKRRRQIEDSDG